MADIITVHYRNVDGLHEFRAEDVPGLYVVSGDLREAYESVAEGLSVLVKIRDGQEVQFTPEMTVEEFERFVCGGPDSTGVPHPAVLAARGVAYRTVHGER